MPREVNYQNEAYDRIKQLIVTSELIPGQRISKNELVKQLGIGETPIREAIILLRKDGLFQIVPQSGTYVSKINLQEMFQARFVRENIETMIFETVCDVITEEQLQELERQLKIQRIYFEEGNREMYFKLDEEFHHFFL
jgi:Transcriptional regulators